MTKARKIRFAVVTTLGLLLALEFLLHLWAPAGGLIQGNPEPTEGGVQAIMMRGSPFLLWELAPGSREADGGVVSVNRAGFRDQDRGAKQLPRVLALGDSSVYGFGVGDPDVFTTRLEADFQGEFINGGVPGYSSTQALNLLWGRGLALDPDLLLVATLWSDNNFDAFVDKEHIATYAAWRRTKTASFQAILEHSAIYRVLEYQVKASKPGRVHWMELHQQSPSGNRRVPIGTYARNLTEFCRTMAERGGGVVFVMLPNSNDLTGSVQNPPWVPYRQVMRDAAKACGAPLVDLPAAFRKNGQPHLFMDEMHPSKSGHALMAKTIGATLRGLGWPETPILVHAPSSAVVPPKDTFEGKGIQLGLFGG